MSGIKIEFKITSTGNAAFQDNGKEYEISEMIRHVAKRIEEYGANKGEEFVLRDSNGNTVGKAIIS